MPPPLPSTTRSFSSFDSQPQASTNRLDPSTLCACLAHFDAQSALFSLDYSAQILATLYTPNTHNTKTGASAATASPQSSREEKTAAAEAATKSLKQIQLPNTNTNERNKTRRRGFLDDFGFDLVAACPCFREERGGDAFRGLGLVLGSVLRNGSQRPMMKLNSVSILDDEYRSAFPKDLNDMIEANANQPFTLEYQVSKPNTHNRLMHMKSFLENYIGLGLVFLSMLLCLPFRSRQLCGHRAQTRSSLH